MNKVVKKLSFFALSVLLLSCGKDDSGVVLDPILVSGEIKPFLGEYTTTKITHVVATDLTGNPLGSASFTSAGTYEIERPEGFIDTNYNLYVISESEEFGFNNTTPYKSHRVILYHNISFRRFNDNEISNVVQLDTTSIMEMSLNNNAGVPFIMSYGLNEADNRIDGGGISQRRQSIFSNTNNDIYLFANIEGTPSYQYIPVDEETSEVKLTIPGNEFSTDMVEKKVDLSSLPSQIRSIDFDIDAYGTPEELDWRRILGLATYGNRFGINWGDIPSSVAFYLPPDLSWASFYETSIEVVVDSDKFIEHQYNYANDVPSSIDFITDLSVSYEESNVKVNGSYDLALVDYDYEKATEDRDISFNHFIFTQNPENAPKELPVAVWSLIGLNSDDLTSFSNKIDVSIFRSQEFETLFTGKEWGEGFISDAINFKEVYFDDITGSGTDTNGRKRTNKPDRDAILFL